jgi:hypothetical protein
MGDISLTLSTTTLNENGLAHQLKETVSKFKKTHTYAV